MARGLSFIKAASVSRALAAAKFTEVLVHTGQHFDFTMSGIFFDELEMSPPSYNLDVNCLTHGAMTGRMLEGLEEVMIAEKPDWVLVYGDTNSTLAGALGAAKLQIPLAHVEAGLRSFNRRMPEEMNRIVADHLSTLLLCPTQTAASNLRAESITTGVYHVGDVMYDMTLAATRRAKERSRILDRLKLTPKAYAVATVHRAENTDDMDRFARIMRWLANQGETVPVVMPVHPRARKLIEAIELDLDHVRFIEPLGYLDMVLLTYNAAAVFTDSGGLQKEAYFHRVPCVTLRDETEWVETIEAGWNRLWTTPNYRPRLDISDYGSGRASSRIVELLGTVG